MIRLRLGRDGVDHAPCGTLVIGLYQSERPPRGEAGWIDWRLSGAVSRGILSGRTDAALGTTLLMPSAKLPAARVLFVGLGAPAEMKGRVLGQSIELALAKLSGLRETDFAIALPGSKPWPGPRDEAAVLGEHLIAALARAGRSATVTLLGTPELRQEVREWVRAQGDPVASHVTLDDGPAGPTMTDEERARP